MLELINDKKRKTTTSSSSIRANKKQKINDYQTIEITQKTSYNKQPTEDNAPFGPKDLCIDNESFFISNDDIFKRLQEKENKKYQESIVGSSKKPVSKSKTTDELVNKMNLTLSDLLNNEEGEEEFEERDHEDEDEEPSNSSSSSSQSSLLNKLVIHHNEDDSRLDVMDCEDDDEEEDSMLIQQPKLFKECFLCSHGNSEHDAIYSKHLAELKTMYMTYRGLIKNENLANMMYLYFMEHVYKPGSNMPILTPIMALEHMKNTGKSHTVNATEHLIDSIQLWARVRDNIQDAMYHQDKKADRDQLNGLVTAQKMLNSLYIIKLSNMHFRDPDCTINITKGPVFKIQSLSENNERIIKTKKITQTNIRRHKTIDI